MYNGNIIKQGAFWGLFGNYKTRDDYEALP
jgi:hypothetical protein